jgi:RecA/RadA recombinase
VDKLFMDGWPRASVVEVVGGAGSGKTQLCMAVMVAAASTGATVLAIDTCNGFTHARLLDLAVAARSTGSGGGNALQRKASETSLLKDSQVADTLSRIHVARARDPWTLLDLLSHAADGPVPQQQPQPSHAPPSPTYDVVVVDCLHAAFAPYQHLQMDPAQGAGAGASADALASSAGVLFRRLAAQGGTVLVTNVSTPGGSGGARPAAGAARRPDRTRPPHADASAKRPPVGRGQRAATAVTA